MLKYATYEALLPESEKEKAEMLARPALDMVIAREQGQVISRSEMNYEFVDGHHRFHVEIDVAEAA